jgi:hypothetical protein
MNDFDVKAKRFPRWENLENKCQFVNDLENIRVELLMAPSLDELLDITAPVLLATWDKNARHLNLELNKTELCNVSYEEKMKLFYRSLRGGFLPAFKEYFNIVVLFDGLTFHDCSHIFRSRQWAFQADCSGDKVLNEREITVPESYEVCGYADEYKELMTKMMDLYCKMYNDKRISHHDARLVTPKTMGTFVTAKLNIGDAMRVVQQRNPQTEPSADVIMMEQMWVEICKKYPFMASLIDIDAPSFFYKKEETTCRNFASHFYPPMNDRNALPEGANNEWLYDQPRSEMPGYDEASVFNKLRAGYREELKRLDAEARQKWSYLYTEEYERDYGV